MKIKKLDVNYSDWKEEAIAFYLNNRSMSETLKYINEKYHVSDRAFRSLLKEREINRGYSGANKLKRFDCLCAICKNDFVGRTPTSIMCDNCVGPGAHGATKERLKKYAKIRKYSSYGLDTNSYEELVKIQKNCCGLCLKEMIQPCIDHCHKSGKVRGLLCHMCNLTLGHVELLGKILWLRNAENWIKRG